MIKKITLFRFYKKDINTRTAHWDQLWLLLLN